VAAVISVSVVIPATDGPPTLPRCVDAIADSDDPPDEVIVVDHPTRRSPAGARNDGVRRASGDVVLFVDADVVVHADAVRRVRKRFEHDPSLTAVFGAYDDLPGAPGVVARFRNLLHHHVHHHGAGEASTFWTGLGAVRRSALLDVGGFDERRYPHPSIEDIELGDRLARRGLRIQLDPTIQGTHLKRWTLRTMLVTDFARRGVPWVALQVRSLSLSGSLNMGGRHRASATAIVIATVAVATRHRAVAAVAVAAFVVLNLRFYRLLASRTGPLPTVAGVGLHALHHLVAVAAVPAGVVQATAESVRRPHRAAPRRPAVATTGAAAG
jgi:hypothetical protein